MSHTFSNLSPADFEDLVRDLIGRELGVRFEAFCAGPDGGIDGRHAPSTENRQLVLQAKHFEGSTFAQLKSAMNKERESIRMLEPSRYILATSRKLTPENKNTLAQVIGASLESEKDIFGPTDLNALLRKHPEVEKAHIGLWLSSTAVLEKILRSASHAFAAITKSEIQKKVRIYARNPSLIEAAQTLKKHHVIIISGPPGVGKTTLAEMLAFVYAGDDWELVPMRSLDDAFASISDTKKQMFLFDDFLGKVALDKQALAHKDSELARLVRKIRSSPNARFALTTRAYIFEEARRISEHLADQRLDVSKYVLDVSTYTRRIKARILYNHLVVAGTPTEHVRALVSSGKIPEIVDHKNYSPRVIEWMTDSLGLSDVTADKYASAFLSTLHNPKQLWDTAFRTHIGHKCQHLLFAIFFSSEHGVQAEDLRESFDSLHTVLCDRYRLSQSPKDFEEATRVLEGSFIDIRNSKISFVNPSVRDYLQEYLDDFSLLLLFASSACKIRWAQALWEFGNRQTLEPRAEKEFATAFMPIAAQFSKLPVRKRTRNEMGEVVWEFADASNSDRISLLLAWWYATQDQRFADFLMELMAGPVNNFDAWRDGKDLVRLLVEAQDPEYGEGFPFTDELIEGLEAGLVDLLPRVSTDELDGIFNAVESAKSAMSPLIAKAVEEAVLEQFDHIEYFVEGEESEAALRDCISTLKRWASRYSIPETALNAAVSEVERRIEMIEDDVPDSESPSFGVSEIASDIFDDEALGNLFAPLLFH
ncbi:MAG: restriction endonuclease [Gammaproteobacteria bacterium]|nr:restriction endonuclease [Gammaproteobacteria bacterium]